MGWTGCVNGSRTTTVEKPTIYKTKSGKIYHVPPPKHTPSPRFPIEEPILNGTVVIDAGHGGKDPGAPANSFSNLPEKIIVLDIANRVMDLLEDEGINVIATRRDDRFIELDDRAYIAERAGADLFVSIHADASDNRSASGVTIYICDGASAGSQKAANRIRDTMERNGIETRGIHHANYRVLVKHSRPAVLVECGYMTNYYDARNLNSAGFRAQLASILAEGVLKYFNR
jgi:N-acetylmuramoyl-L-alanine amidase